MSTAQRPALQSLNPNAVAQRSTAAEKQDVSGPVKPTEVAGTASDAVEDLRKANARLEEENRKHAVAAINQQEEIAEWQRAYESLQTEGQELFQTYERKCTMLKQSHKELEEHKALTLAQGKGVVAAEADRNAAVQESEELRVRVKAMSEAAEAAEERFYSIKEEHSRSLARLDEVEVQLRAASFAARAPTGDGVDAAKIVSLESSVATLEATIKELRQAQSVALEGSGAGEDAVSALPQMTPSRAKSAAFLTPGKSKKPAAAPRTPSGFMLEVDCLSPDGLKEHLESLAISNDLLRQELAGIRKERDSQSEELRAAEGRAAAAQEGALPLQAKLRAAAAQVKTLTEARDEAIAEAEAVHRDLAELQDERHLGSHALQVEVDAAKEAAEAANAARGAAVEELEKLRRQLEKQSEATKNAENDMRLMYKRHKKETQEVADKFQAGAYEARYEAAVAKAQQLEALLANWVNFAKEASHVRSLHVHMEEAETKSVAGAKALVEDARAMKNEAEGKCAKWERQCKRMEREMTELVGIKTRALESRKETHERYIEMLEECKAQGEYTSSLEEEVQGLNSDIATLKEELGAMQEDIPQQVAAAKEEGAIEERARGPSEEEVAAAAKLACEAQVQAVMSEILLGVETQTLEGQVVTLEAQLKEYQEAEQASDALFEQTAVAMQENVEERALLAARVATLEQDERDTKTNAAEAEAFAETETAATNEALDEMVRNLAVSQVALAAAQERAEVAEERAGAAMAAAAIGIARLTTATVEHATDEDDTTQMIDEELRLHWCDPAYEAKLAANKTPLELRALMVSVVSTANNLLRSGKERDEAHTHRISMLEEMLSELQGRRAEAEDEMGQMAEALDEAQRGVRAMEVARAEEGADVEEKDRLIDALESTVADSNAAAAAAVAEKAEMNAILEETTRENMALSEAMAEAEGAVPERDMLRAQYEDLQIQFGKAGAVNTRKEVEVQKRITVLTANLHKSESEGRDLDAIICYARAILQQVVEMPGYPGVDKDMKMLLSRLSTDDSHDDE